MSTVEIIKHTQSNQAVTTPAISPKFVEIDDNFEITDVSLKNVMMYL